jgi:hypothetical protein
MNKEAILTNHGEAWEYSNQLQVCPLVEAHNAMDEYAKQQAIAFGIWIHKEGWVQSSDNLVTDNLWYHEDNDETYLTTQQLHDLFIEHQKQNNQ